MSTYTIGKLAGITDLSVETIRYYERRGLLERPAKPATGYRRYSDDARKRISFIRRAKELGFTLGRWRRPPSAVWSVLTPSCGHCGK